MKLRPTVSRAVTLIRAAERIAAITAASIRLSCAQASPPPPVNSKLWSPILSVIVPAGEILRDRRMWSCPRTWRRGR